MGTTKLTRKEILAEDPVHEAIVGILEFFRVHGKKVAVLAAAAAVIALAVYGAFLYLESREAGAQEHLGRGMDFFHGEIAADATEDPYAKGATPTFRSDADKYQAAAREFSTVISSVGYSKLAIIARYYLGLTQMQLGQREEALKNLEAAAGNSRNRTIGYLAKKRLAGDALDQKDYQRAAEILQAMIKDPKCDLPKEELNLQLARALEGQGKQEEALKVLREAGSKGPAFSAFKQKILEEQDRLEKASKRSPTVPTAQP